MANGLIQKKKKEFIVAVGRRKESVARIRIYQTIKPGSMIGGTELKKGDILINNKLVKDYFKNPVFESMYLEPLKATNNIEKVAISVRVEGGGQKGQLEAIVLGISRALSAIDDKNRAILKKKGLLTRDARVRQRRKVGMGGKSRRQKQSPKR